MNFLVAGIFALLGGAANAVDTILGINKAKEDAEDQLAFIDSTYKLQKDKAKQDYDEAKRQAEKNAELANKQADIADLQANLADQSLNASERAVSNDFNTAIDNLYLSGAQDAWQWNNAAMQAGSSEGAALAGLAGSGVRAGSSLSDAVLMESATNEAQLQFAQDTKRRSDNNNLASVLNGLAGTQYNIMGERLDADVTRMNADVTRQNALDLVNSYLEGGYNYNIYDNQKQQMEKTWKYNRGKVEDIKKANSWDSWEAWAKLGTGILTGASSGYQTGANLYNFAYEAADYETGIPSLFKKKEKKTTTTSTKTYDWSKFNNGYGGAYGGFFQ